MSDHCKHTIEINRFFSDYKRKRCLDGTKKLLLTFFFFQLVVLKVATTQEINVTTTSPVLNVRNGFDTSSGKTGAESKKDANNILFSKSNFTVVCDKDKKNCNIQLQNVLSKSVQLMAEYTESMFNIYANNSYMSVDDMKVFLFDIGVLKSASTMTDSHDHDHDYSLEDLYDAYSFDYVFAECLKTVDDLIVEYYPADLATADVKISLVDFYVMLPRLIYQLQDSSCSSSGADDHSGHDHGSTQNEVRANVWGIALGSVAIISALAVVGICIVPLMRHSIYFNRLISFLVALAVGTLVGDALLHLLPHSMGSHDHSGHDHGDSNHGEEEKNVIYKSLVAVVGIYLFFLVESIMGLVRERKRKLKKKACSDKSHLSTPTIQSPVKSGATLLASQYSNEPLIYSSETKKNSGDNHIKSNGDCQNEKSQNTAKYDDEVVIINHKEPCNGDGDILDEKHSHHGHQHNHSNFTNESGIKDMAWMIIMGDGLHNFSDGLAIGAAFSSSVAAGLSTSLAVFCHELPHELGDFAILINAGMSIKQAIVYNILSACCAFIGVIIGLAIGEFSDSIKLWILAITAGGFLYVALVGMLPEMLEATTKKDGVVRFVVQNVGLILGVLIMVFIALYEEKFHSVFS